MDAPKRPSVTRQILRSALASSGLGLAIGYPALTFAQSAAPAAQCHDADEATIRQTEGTYFKPSSPQRADLVEPETKARLVEINGQVLTRSCRPVERALVDLWHADERGEYDNAGFHYRGQLFAQPQPKELAWSCQFGHCLLLPQPQPEPDP
jgi:Dioxygenase